MAGATKPQTLNHTGLETIKLFKQIRAIDNLAGTTGHEEWPKAEFAAEADRFELWAVNLGLFVSGHGSLDYRVRQAESIGYTLRRFLTGLNNALAEGQSQLRLYRHVTICFSLMLTSNRVRPVADRCAR